MSCGRVPITPLIKKLKGGERRDVEVQMTQPKKDYIRVQEGETLYFLCPHCPKKTKRQNTMFYHLEKHSGETKHNCTMCSKGFIQKSGLQQHMAQTHPEVEDATNPYLKQEWSCPCCDHVCRMKANMLIHIARKHAKSWIPYYDSSTSECSGCAKHFASPSAYYYHSMQCLPVPEEMATVLAAFR